MEGNIREDTSNNMDGPELVASLLAVGVEDNLYKKWELTATPSTQRQRYHVRLDTRESGICKEGWQLQRSPWVLHSIERPQIVAAPSG